LFDIIEPPPGSSQQIESGSEHLSARSEHLEHGSEHLNAEQESQIEKNSDTESRGKYLLADKGH
jgi:hypothetical protein